MLSQTEKVEEIKTTGELRTVLARSIKWVLNGSMDLDKAMAVHKLAKNISESLYSETKIAMFRKEAEQPMEPFGDLKLGTSAKDGVKK